MNEEQLKEFNERRAKFLESYGKLTEEFQCDFLSFPQYIPNEKGLFDLKIATEILDKKYASVKSPFL